MSASGTSKIFVNYLNSSHERLPPFSLTRGFGKQNTRGNVLKISDMLLTDRIEIHQSQPASMTKRRSKGHTSGCDWWILIQFVDNMQDWRKF